MRFGRRRKGQEARRPVSNGGRDIFHPDEMANNGDDDHPMNQCQCADCGMLYHRSEVQVWCGNAYICGKCDKDANELPFEDDDA